MIRPQAIESTAVVLAWLLRALVVPIGLLLGLIWFALHLAGELLGEALLGAAMGYRRLCAALRIWRFLGKPWAIAWRNARRWHS